MSNNIPKIPNQKEYKDLTPFDLVLIQKFPFIEEDFDAINIYGIISKIKDYLNTTIANEQIVTENQQNVFKGFTDLHNYVEDYFTNLDVQDEINNKLDEMAESGELQTIIETFLNSNAVFGYNTVSDMQSATNLIVGSHAKTCGYNYINDGAGADYIIQAETTDIRLSNGLYAKKIEDKCEFIFPGKWGLDATSGNSNLIKVGEKVILIDANSQTVYNYLKLMLAENNVSHIDYVIITHFDSDHRGNLINLINDGYIDNNSKYIHPDCPVQIYGQAVHDIYEYLENVCVTNGIQSIIPTENQVINVTNNFSMRFGNVDTLYTLNNYVNPNEASMVIECKHNNFCSLFTGDALLKTEKHLVDSGFIKNEIGLYTIPHHAIESRCYAPFYDLINPKFAVAQSQNGNYNINLFTTNQSSALLSEKGCANYFSFYNDTNIHFVEKNGSIECTQGKPIVCSGHAYNNLDIYCDSVRYNENRQDGSEDYPFKDLPQALGQIRDWNNQHVIIHLNAGTYGTAYTGTNTPSKNKGNIFNRKNYIEIVGHSAEDTFINNGFSIANSSNVVIRNITIRPDYDDHFCAYIVASKVLFIDCKFIGTETTDYVGSGIRTAFMSDVSCNRCEFKYLVNAYYILGGAKVRTNSDLISNLTTFARVENNVEVSFGTFDSNSDFSTVDNFDNYNASTHILANPQKMTKNVTTTMSGNIELPVSSQNNFYKYLVVNYALKYLGSTIGRSKKIIPFENISSLLISDYNARDNNTIDTFTLVATITNNNFSILRNTCTHIASNGTLTSHTPESSTDTQYGIQITSIDLI